MKNLTIKFRILILGILAVGGLVVAGGFGLIQLSRFNSQLEADLAGIRVGVETLVNIQTASIDFKTQVQEWKNILIRGNKEEDFARYEKLFFEKEKVVQERLKKAVEVLKKENAPSNTNAINDLEKLIKDHAELGSSYRSALAGFNKSDPDAGKKVDVAVKGKDRETTEGINKIVLALEKSEFEHFDKQIVSAQISFVNSRNLLIGMIMIGLVLTGGIAFVTLRQISAQIENVQSATTDIKQNLNLTRRISISGNDEMAQVAISVNALLEEFQSVLRSMKEAGSHVSCTSDELSNSVSQLSAAVEQQNEATSSMAASVEEMAVSVTHVSDSSTTAQGIAQESRTNAKAGGQIIDQTVREMVEMAESVQGTSRTMEKLSQRTDEIGSIVSVIKEIADQTNLLALNAAIEAARAGEQGRGFAVVADEVRKLAERTTLSTKEVADVISAIQNETRHAVADMSLIAIQVTKNAESAQQAGDSIIQIREGSDRVVEVSSDIATALKEQSTASEMIAKQVEVIASMSEENTAAMSEARKASEALKKLSTEMQQMVDRFKV
ncbi:MAG: methyl-accepting chemotaxis protein [Betaproteobacteria bacterium]